MTQDQLIHTLQEYLLNNPADMWSVNCVIDWIEEHWEFAFVKENFDWHLTGSMVIINPEHSKILLMLHKKFGRWQQFWGHCDGEIDVCNVALREFREESGVIIPPVLIPGIFHVAIHDIPEDKKGRPPHHHFDLLYLWVLPEDTPMNHETSEVDGIGWFTFEEACQKNQEDLMKTIITKIHNLQ